jgi:polyisoprenoid-binding protein YceI
MKRHALLAALLFAAASPAALAETYTIDPNHTQVRFQYHHFELSNIVGIFSGVTGEIVYDPAKPEASSVKASIPLAEVHTGVADFNDHLRSADFFDVARFPTATFTSSKVVAVGEGRLQVTGELAVRDIKREVTLDVKVNALKVHPMSQRASAGFEASTALKRTELGVGKYAPNVGDDVAISITVEASVPKQ